MPRRFTARLTSSNASTGGGLWAAVLLGALVGCQPLMEVDPGAFIVERGAMQIGPETQPAVQVDRGAVSLTVEPGAVAVHVTTPAIPERPLWIGILVVGALALLSYPLQRWVRIRMRRNKS